MPSLSSKAHMASLSYWRDINAIASVGLKPSAMLSANADLISSADFPFIDFAFIKIFMKIDFQPYQLSSLLRRLQNWQGRLP